MHTIRHIMPGDSAIWAKLRHDLWSESSIEHHAAEIEQFFAGVLNEPEAVLVAQDEAGEIIGLAELATRGKVARCATSRVGFVEGLYVVPNWRHAGIARPLLRAWQSWAMQQGCSEFASDRPHGFVIDRRFGDARQH
jgi:aminoglycoside 6'-N-acetyltransferase I